MRGIDAAVDYGNDLLGRCFSFEEFGVRFFGADAKDGIGLTVEVLPISGLGMG